MITQLHMQQTQLIRELNMIAEHLTQLETEMAQVVAHCREGVILTSIPGIGPQAAATLIAMIGTIANSEHASQLKPYVGWVPKVAQSGSSLDWTRLSPDK